MTVCVCVCVCVCERGMVVMVVVVMVMVVAVGCVHVRLIAKRNVVMVTKAQSSSPGWPRRAACALP
jgi:hypothetical protein